MISKIRYAGYLDLLAAVMFSIFMAAITIYLPASSLLSLLLALILLMFLPGYALIAALFPGKGDLSILERIVLSFGLSIAVTPLIGYYLDSTTWGIRAVPMTVSLAAFIAIASGIGFARRMIQPEEARFSIDIGPIMEDIKNCLRYKAESRIDKVIAAMLIISIAASVLSIIYVTANPKQGDTYTEFYVLGPGGMASDYPTALVAGNSGKVMVEIANHEQRTVDYAFALKVNNSTVFSRGVKLDDGQSWKSNVSFVPEHPGPRQKIELILYADGNYTSPYRDLYLLVDVSNPQNAGTTRSNGK
jgi:uncharacterized membrane protein